MGWYYVVKYSNKFVFLISLISLEKNLFKPVITSLSFSLSLNQLGKWRSVTCTLHALNATLLLQSQYEHIYKHSIRDALTEFHLGHFSCILFAFNWFHFMLPQALISRYLSSHQEKKKNLSTQCRHYNITTATMTTYLEQMMQLLY